MMNLLETITKEGGAPAEWFAKIINNWPDEHDREELKERFLRDPVAEREAWKVGDQFYLLDPKTVYMICKNDSNDMYFLLIAKGRYQGNQATEQYKTIQNIFDMSFLSMHKEINPVFDRTDKAGDNADSI